MREEHIKIVKDKLVLKDATITEKDDSIQYSNERYDLGFLYNKSNDTFTIRLALFANEYIANMYSWEITEDKLDSFICYLKEILEELEKQADEEKGGE